MNATRLGLLTSACVLQMAAMQAWAWYNPQTGRWLSRDPVGEPGFLVLQATYAQPQQNSGAALPAGRWFNRDPIGESGSAPSDQETPDVQRDLASPYVCAGNNPVDYIDPLGLLKLKGCSDYQKGQLEGNLRQFCSLVKNKNKEIGCCLGKPHLADCLKSKCDALESMTFICESKESGHCKSSKPGLTVCAWTKPWGNNIHICPGFWTTCNNHDSDWGCIIIHEMAHTCVRTETTARNVEKCLGCRRALDR